MALLINVYCDESCHLEHDEQKSMVLGALWCPALKSREVADRIRDIKRTHKLPPDFEIKWTKVSPGKLQFYIDIVDYFFDDNDLHFRALIIPDKRLLRHGDFDQTHNEWYYKMYFDMIKVIVDPQFRYRIYIDIKDTRGAERVKKLHEVLCNDRYDHQRNIFERLQQVRSHEVEQMQMADLLIGAVSYANRDLSASPAKSNLVARIRQRSRYSLTRTTWFRENKMNMLVWEGSH